MGNPIFGVIVGTSSYLFLVGWADVEAGHHDCCTRHQVEFGVGSAVVSRPEGKQTKTTLRTFWNGLLSYTVSVAKDIMVMVWRIGPLSCLLWSFPQFHFTKPFLHCILKQRQLYLSQGQIKTAKRLGEGSQLIHFTLKAQLQPCVHHIPFCGPQSQTW